MQIACLKLFTGGTLGVLKMEATMPRLLAVQTRVHALLFSTHRSRRCSSILEPIMMTRFRDNKNGPKSPIGDGPFVTCTVIDVLFCCAPFKIVDTVIQFSLIKMIDLRQIIGIGNE